MSVREHLPREGAADRPMDASVVICTYNSAKRLGPTLRHLRQQVVPDTLRWEVIVVDHCSTDGTQDVVRDAWAGCTVPLALVLEQRAGKTPALESGFSRASGEAICVIDDDNWAVDSFVANAVNILNAHADVGVIGGMGVPEPEGHLPPWFPTVLNMYAVGPQADRDGYAEPPCYSFWGAGSVVRRSAWLRAKSAGFKPVLNPSRGDGVRFTKGFTGGEDPELCYAVQLAGYRLFYSSALIYKHYIPKQRLTKAYVESTAEGVNMASPILKVYRATVDARRGRGRLKYKVYCNWYLHLFASIASLTFNYLITIRKHDDAAVARSRRGYLGQVRGLLFWRAKYSTIVREIKAIR